MLTKRPLTATVAVRLRERGLMLFAEGHEYATPRLEQVARRQHELMAEFERLDEELRAMAKAEAENC